MDGADQPYECIYKAGFNISFFTIPQAQFWKQGSEIQNSTQI